MSDESVQRVSWNLPASAVDRVKAYQEAHDMGTQSEAAAALLSSANLDTDTSTGHVITQEAGATSLADERHSVPEFVDPHESYPTRPMVAPGETVRTVGTDGQPIAEGTTGVIGDSEQTAEDLPNVGENDTK